MGEVEGRGAGASLAVDHFSVDAADFDFQVVRGLKPRDLGQILHRVGKQVQGNPFRIVHGRRRTNLNPVRAGRCLRCARFVHHDVPLGVAHHVPAKLREGHRRVHHEIHFAFLHRHEHPPLREREVVREPVAIEVGVEEDVGFQLRPGIDRQVASVPTVLRLVRERDFD